MLMKKRVIVNEKQKNVFARKISSLKVNVHILRNSCMFNKIKEGML